MTWRALLDGLVASLRKWGEALFAFLAGRASAKADARMKELENEVARLQVELATCRGVMRDLGDDELGERLRDLFTRPGDEPGKPGA